MAFADEIVKTANNKKKKKQTQSFADQVINGTYKGKVNAPLPIPAAINNAKSNNKSNNDWLRLGAFDDGYDFGDVTKTLLGTATDVGQRFTKGVQSSIEGLLDWGANTLSGATEYFGADKATKDLRNWAQKDFIKDKDLVNKTITRANPILSLLNTGLKAKENFSDGYNVGDVSKTLIGLNQSKDLSNKLNELSRESALGEKSKGIVEGVGQLGGQVALQALGVPWQVTAFTNSAGSEMNNAFKNNATYGQAFTSGLISGATEVLTEKIGSGANKALGMTSLGSKAIDKLGSKISNKVASRLLKMGIDAGSEGLEEVLSGLGTAVGQKLTYMSDKEINELYSKEQALDEFISGALVSGVANIPGNIQSIKRGENAFSGLTENEQKVLDKELQNRIQEQQKDGKKLSQKEINKIEEQVRNDMAKGRISVETIEETLGGNNTTQNDVLLQNSYNERANRSVAYNADLSKYKGTQKEIVQKAIDSGVLNNTNRSHEMVDLVAKLAEDKGMDFDFVNNEKLKDTGFALEGRQVNGYKDGNTIGINIDSNKALNSIIGHEITHVLEGTDLYQNLQESIVEYAKSKGEYDTRLKELAPLYTDKQLNELTNEELQEITNELTSDMVGDYLFTDEDFVNRLYNNNRNVFQKIYDEIKYLVKQVAPGSKEAKQLEQVKRAFEKAYNQRSTNQSNSTQYSVKSIDENRLYAYNDDSRKINTSNLDTAGESVARYINNNIRHNKDITIKAIDGENLTITKDTAYKIASRDNVLNSNGKYEKLSDELYAVKLRAGMYIDELAQTSRGNNNIKPDTKNHKFAKDGFTYRKAYYMDNDGQYYSMNLSIGKNGEINTIYNLGKIKEAEFPQVAQRPDSKTIGEAQASTKQSIPQSKQNVKYSISNVDNQGRELSKQQQEYFKDSKVRDENGRLLEVYHGTKNGNFTVFDTSKSGENWKGWSKFGKGIYFTDAQYDAKDWAMSSKGNGKIRILKSYLDIKNPLYANSKNVNVFKEIAKQYNINIDRFYNISDVINELTKLGADTTKYLIEKGYDGIIQKGREYVVFNSNQIKNVDNLNPTTNDDIRYSLSEQNKKIAPVGNYQIKGKDVKLEKIAPVKPKTEVKETTKIAPVKEDTKKRSVPIPMVKNDNVLKVTAEDIAKQINKNGDFNIKQRSWTETSTESEPLKGKVFIEDLDPSKITYEVQSNKKSLDKANKHLDTYGYEKSLEDVNSLIRKEGLPSASDVALMQRMIQEASKRGDAETVQNLIMDTAILGTDLGQATQALSIIQRLTPEGQLKMYTKLVNRAKARGEKSFQNVEITPEMVEKIISAYNQDGTYDQADLNARVESFKQDLANQMKSTVGEKVNAWRYLSMLGNPKTHIRNIVSNVAMKGTIKVKNAMARTLETLLPVKDRTKTWKKASNEIKDYAARTTQEMKDIITGEGKYNEKTSLEAKKQIFKTKTLEKLSNLNSAALEAEDWLFSKSAFKSTFQEYLTANGINTMEDVKNNPEVIQKAKNYAVEQAQIATFRQYSKLAAMLNQFERRSDLGRLGVEATVPFKKTPINVAKAGVAYSPLGLAKTLIYDGAIQLRKGDITASQFIDNLSQGLTGSSLMLLGVALARAGILSGSGSDDKEGKYDSQLGNTGYSINLGGKSYSIAWLSPVAMPLLVGANAYEKFEEQEEWDMNIVTDTLAKTLDPLNEMSFMQGVTKALTGYNKGAAYYKGIAESTAQSYINQFFPTLLSQIASVTDDTKRSTKASANSKFKFGEETVRGIMYKIPGLRQQLEATTDIWGNEKKQSENIVERAFETFLAPYTKTDKIATELDDEIKRVYNEVGDIKVIPGVPQAFVKYGDETYRMSANEYTEYKKTYGKTANEQLNKLIGSNEYQEATDEEKSKMIQNIYDYSKAEANKEYFEKNDVDYSNDTLTKIDTLKDKYNIDASTYFANKKEYDYAYQHPEKYNTIKQITSYDKYNTYKDKIKKIRDNTTNDKAEIIKYINSLKLSVPQKAMFIKQYYKSYTDYDNEIINYINSKKLSTKEKQQILEELNFVVRDGRVYAK